MNFKQEYKMTSKQLERLAILKQDYKELYQNPQNCRPKIIIHVQSQASPDWQCQLADPLVMLKAQLDVIQTHLQMEDDYLPAVRVNFGTGIIAAAFACELALPEKSLPAVSAHALQHIAQVDYLEKPSFTRKIYTKIEAWTSAWLERLPEGIAVQSPDIQGPFNTAHLVRGNDIFTDLYDDPERVCRLLDLVTDHTIEVLNNFNRIGKQTGSWFHDWSGAYWKGRGRISNCSVDMISPEFYCQYVLPRDIRFMHAIGGGRMHYCGGSEMVISHFIKNPGITGLDVDAGLHDIWQIAAQCPLNLVLAMEEYNHPFPHLDRLLAGDWPEKRNVILYTSVKSVEEGRRLLSLLRKSIPY